MDSSIPFFSGSDRPSLFVLVEPALHERDELLDRLLRILPRGPDLDLRTPFGGQHHHPHDALAVHFHGVPCHVYVGDESRREPHEVGGRTGVQPQPIDDPDRGAAARGHHGKAPWERWKIAPRRAVTARNASAGESAGPRAPICVPASQRKPTTARNIAPPTSPPPPSTASPAPIPRPAPAAKVPAARDMRAAFAQKGSWSTRTR